VSPAAARVLAIGLGTALAVIAAEGVARVVRGPDLVAVVRAGFEPAEASTAMAVRVGDGRVFGARPGFVGGAVSINAHGTRGPARPLDRGEDVARVVVLGDSVAFGQEIPYSDTLGARVETLLGERGARRWEVWNLAFPGYNTVQSAAALGGLGARLAPDVVVLVWVTNDAASLEVPLGGSVGGPALYVERRVHLLPGLGERLQIAAWRRSALFRSLGDALGGPNEVLLEEEEHRAAIAAIAAQCDSLGAPLVFAMVPPLIDYAGWREGPHPGRPTPPWAADSVWRSAREQATASGAIVVDLTMALAGRRPSDVRLDEIHPNALGHRLIATTLAERIAGLAPE